MKELIEHLEVEIASSKKNKEPKDRASWNYQEGVLLTRGEAMRIVKALSKVNNCVIPVVSTSEVFYHYGKQFTSGRDLWDFLTENYNFTPKT